MPNLVLLALQHQPGTGMYPPHQHFPMSPQANYQADNGWYQYGYHYSNHPPYHHPPGLSVPPPPPPPRAPPPVVPVPQTLNNEIVTVASTFIDILQLDDFWKGRLAPLPGYQSRPGLVPKQVQIGVPAEVKQESPKAPPSFGNEYPTLALTNKSEVSSSVTDRPSGIIPLFLTESEKIPI